MFDIITIGTATRDVFLSVKGMKTISDKKELKKMQIKFGEAECFPLGAKLEMESPIFTVGGVAANAAVTFARQKIKTGFFAKLGTDEFAEKIIRVLRKEGIVSYACHEHKKGTAYSTIFLTSSGERTVLVYRGASEDVCFSDLPLKKMKTRWVYIAPGGISYQVLLKIVDYFFAKGVRIAINPSKNLLKEHKEHMKRIFSKCSVVCVNREEASYVTGVSFEKREELFRSFARMVPGISIMTDGKDGAYAHERGYVYFAKSMKEKRCIDRTGAGDAFCSGFVSGLVHKKSILEALRIGSANATSIVEHIGAEKGVLYKNDINLPRFKNISITIKKI